MSFKRRTHVVRFWKLFEVIRLRVSLGCLEFDICELSRNFRFVLLLTGTSPQPYSTSFFIRLTFLTRTFRFFHFIFRIFSNSSKFSSNCNTISKCIFLVKEKPPQRVRLSELFRFVCEFGWNFCLKWLLNFFPQSKSFVNTEIADGFCTQRC